MAVNVKACSIATGGILPRLDLTPMPSHRVGARATTHSCTRTLGTGGFKEAHSTPVVNRKIALSLYSKIKRDERFFSSPVFIRGSLLHCINLRHAIKLRREQNVNRSVKVLIIS